VSRKPSPRRRSRPKGAAPRKRGHQPSAALRRIVLAVIAVLVLAPVWLVWSYIGPGPSARQGVATTVMLDKGAGVAQIAKRLHEAGVIRSPLLFVTAARLTGAASHLKAGEYEVPSHAAMTRVLADIRNGRVVRHGVSIPEGFTSEMAAEAVNRQDVLVGEAVAPPEGTILPDTYQVQRGEDRAEVIGRMRAAQDKLLATLWANRQPGLPFATPMEAVTLASIVEKETALPAERPRIAAVFLNRLRNHIRLESDPTIIYGVSRGRPLGRGITYQELTTATPWNTYRIDGLPPTPIANPGRAALEAVLNPPKSDDLFFVADGSGGHVFASTFEQHQKNVARWREVERAQAAKTKEAAK
jgi:UPF0755 protein